MLSHKPNTLFLIIAIAALTIAWLPVFGVEIPGKQTVSLTWKPLDEPGSGGWMTGMRISPHDSKRILLSGDMLGVGLSTDGGKSWQATTGFKSWEIGDLTWHPKNPDIAWAGTVSGPYVSMDGGHTWQERRVGMPGPLGLGHSAPIEKVLFDPNDVNHLFAIGGSSRRWDMIKWEQAALGVVWESRDAGQHWTRLVTLTADGYSSAPEAKGVNIVSAAFAAGSSRRLYAALDGQGVRVSEDGGKTWQSRNTGLPHLHLERIIAHPSRPNTVFASLDNYQKPDKTCLPGGIYKSEDAGMHWVSISNGLRQNSATDPNLTARYKAFAVSESRPEVMFTNDWAFDAGVTYTTTDGGAHWRPVVTKGNFGQKDDPATGKVFRLANSQPAGLGMTVFSIDPNHPEVAFGMNSDSIIATRDGGKTWEDGLCYHPSASTPQDAWRGRGFTGWVSTNFRFDPYHPGVSVFQAMDAARVWVSRDNLTTWTRYLNDPAPWNGGVDAAFTRDGHIYVTTGTFNFNGIARSADSGKTWTLLKGAEHGLPDFYQGSGPVGIYALPDDSKVVWAVVGGKLLQSADAGDHWQTVFAADSLTWIAADPKNPKRFYVSGQKNVYQTEDGLHFIPLGGPHNKNGRLTVDGLGRVVVAAFQGDRPGVWRYDGKTWTRLWDDYWTANVAVAPTDPTRLALTTNTDPYKDYCDSTGVWISADDGKTWSMQNTGLPMTRGSVIAFNPHDPTQLVWGANGRGFWTTRWPHLAAPSDGKTYRSTPDDAKFAAVQLPPAVKPFTLVIKNGSMTQGGATPAFWDGKFGDAETKRDTEVFKTAPASFRVTVSGGKSGQGFQVVQGGANATFKIAGWIKSAGAVKAQIAIQAFAEGYAQNQFIQVQFVQNDTDWTHFEKEIKLLEWTAFFNVLLLAEGDGKAWLDDVHEASTAIEAGRPEDALTTGPPASGKPWEAGWGFYSQFPTAWLSVHKGFLDRTKQGGVSIVFLGDSITQGWNDPNGGKDIWVKRYAPLGAVNYGIGGDSTRQVLWRIQHAELDGLTPKLLVLKIGTNNLYGDHNAGTDEEIAQGITEIVRQAQAKLPKTKILLLGLLPRQNGYFSGRVRHINTLIAKLDNGHTVRFLDMGAKFAASPDSVLKELYVPDQLHLSKKGYEVWSAAMQPLLDEMLH